MAQIPNRLTAFTQPLQRLPRPVLYGGAGAIVIAVLAIAFASGVGNQDHYQYAFTNLGPEDSAEIAEHLKAAAIPFRIEGGGGAVAVPSDKVYDARLLLAAVGLPRGGGVGFEIFDRGDIGVSEFTQRVNLQRAIEGELARTIGHLSEVRSARVHISLEEKSLFRDDQHKAAAAVVLNLQPGRTLDDRSIAGIRHLVASSVSGLSADAVTLVDGRGQALTTSPDENNARQSADLEHTLEQRIVALLETVVGPGSVVAKVSAMVDDSEVTTSSEVYDPDSAALRSEHKTSQGQSQDNSVQGGVAGAVANQPAVQLTTTAPTGSRTNSNNEDELKNYELSKTVTHTVKHSPRLIRLSAAVLVDGVNGKPRPPEEVTRLGELAKRAVGFDAARGDVLEMTSEVFARSTDEGGAPAVVPPPSLVERYKWWGAGAGGLLILIVLALLLTRRRPQPEPGLLRAGVRVSELEQGLQPGMTFAPPLNPPALQDPAVAMRGRALELARLNPQRASHLLRAWIASDADTGAKNG